MSWNNTNCTLKQIQDRLQNFNKERNWGQYHNPRNLAMALSVEAAELLELFLWCSDQGPQPAVPSRAPKVEEEAADVLICLLNLCAISNIDLASAVDKKIKKNAEKYPVEKAYGKMQKHNEF